MGSPPAAGVVGVQPPHAAADISSVEECRSCGARLFEGASFCARCLSPVVASEDEVAQGLGEVAAAGGRWVGTTSRSNTWTTDPRHSEPLPAKVHSRWKASPESFPGPVKLLLTATIAVGIPLAFYKVAGPFSFGPILIWWLTIAPRSVRDLWRRTRVR